jgi:tyrosyl-tRNA synthetase
MTFLEFNYPILQAYDFVELTRRYDCALQMGGSDQWGNIVAGVELGRRVAGKPLFGLTTPLMATASGVKMGKSVGGAIWLNAERLSPYEYWQYWRDCEDADIGRFLRLFTELPLAEIARLEALKDGEINQAKKVLATEATAMCHGRAAAEGAAKTAEAVFANGGSAEGLPQVTVAKDTLASGVPAFELFVRAGLAASNGEARRLIKGGGARLNDTVMTSETQPVSVGDFGAAGQLKLSAGRKRHVLVRLG